jgi:hypothetical protein
MNLSYIPLKLGLPSTQVHLMNYIKFIGIMTQNAQIPPCIGNRWQKVVLALD